MLALSPLLRWHLCHRCTHVGEQKGAIFKLLVIDTYIISRVALIFNIELILDLLDDVLKLQVIATQEDTIIYVHHEYDVITEEDSVIY